jgi:uncharacterized membrane protein YkoI
MKNTLRNIVGLAFLALALPATAAPESILTPQAAREKTSAVPEAFRQLALSGMFERAVGRQQAARIAKRTIQKRTGKAARVTGVEREDDFGARWEVEVTLRQGREFDVYVNRSGRIVKIIQKGRGTPGTDPGTNPGTNISKEEASAVALAHIEKLTGSQARVTGVGPEDDYGARWEVEVTRADGFEYDVYIDSNGRVIRVKEIGFDG